jgi:hypothetical protein
LVKRRGVRTEDMIEEFVRRVEKVAVDWTRRWLVWSVLVSTEEVMEELVKRRGVRTEDMMEEFVRRVEKVAVEKA